MADPLFDRRMVCDYIASNTQAEFLGEEKPVLQVRLVHRRESFEIEFWQDVGRVPYLKTDLRIERQATDPVDDLLEIEIEYMELHDVRFLNDVIIQPRIEFHVYLAVGSDDCRAGLEHFVVVEAVVGNLVSPGRSNCLVSSKMLHDECDVECGKHCCGQRSRRPGCATLEASRGSLSELPSSASMYEWYGNFEAKFLGEDLREHTDLIHQSP